MNYTPKTTRRTYYGTVNGETLPTLSRVARRVGISCTTLLYRINTCTEPTYKSTINGNTVEIFTIK